MHYVYLIQSINHIDQCYIGLAIGLKRRLNEHNAGKSIHTNKFKPWKLIAYIAFAQQASAEAFEKYLKQGSGHAFASKHFWCNSV
jgi:putative endonuclease